MNSRSAQAEPTNDHADDAEARRRGAGDETDDGQLVVMTRDRGLHSFPADCPPWCDRAGHLQFALENDALTAAEVTEHSWHGGDAVLDELRNYVSGEVERPGGGRWTLVARQALQDPYTSRAGYASPPLVELTVGKPGLEPDARINLTSGEARVLAVHLASLCDHVDLAGQQQATKR
jgi:hypothetical protein